MRVRRKWGEKSGIFVTFLTNTWSPQGHELDEGDGLVELNSDGNGDSVTAKGIH